MPFHFFRLLLPMENPAGFGVADFILFGLAAVMAPVLVLHRPLESAARRLAQRPAICFLCIAALPVLLRLALLGSHPIPTPRVSDDFSYLLLADTLTHLRFANPVHPMHRFFETVFILQQPSYASIFPPGQGMALVAGELFFGQAWAGVLLSVAALCGLCYWMLRGWVTPAWALAGGVLAAMEFGPLSPWMNTYWGGAVSGVAGCLVFGALPRILNHHRTRDAVLLGAGLGLQLLSRPYEFLLLVLAVLLFSLPPRALLTAGLVLLPAAGLTLMQNKQVTGSWITLPYMLSRYQYGIPATFTFQPVPVPHHALTVEQQIDYDAQSATHGTQVETPGRFTRRLLERISFYRFFFLAPLYAALPFFAWSLRQPGFLKAAIALAIFALGTNFYPYFYPHYAAAATCLFVLVSVKGLQNLSALRFGTEAARLLLLLCLAHFLFWYGIHLSGNRNVELATAGYESWDAINDGDPEGRISINTQLARASGKQLVFVRYWPQHGPFEWIRNEAGIDRARIVWALDLGPEEDAKLRRYYPDRGAWLLEPDARPPRLTRF